eukprot:5023354-Pyramimonas_sp.AAC.1
MRVTYGEGVTHVTQFLTVMYVIPEDVNTEDNIAGQLSRCEYVGEVYTTLWDLKRLANGTDGVNQRTSYPITKSQSRINTRFPSHNWGIGVALSRGPTNGPLRISHWRRPTTRMALSASRSTATCSRSSSPSPSGDQIAPPNSPDSPTLPTARLAPAPSPLPNLPAPAPGPNPRPAPAPDPNPSCRTARPP